jgi:hypothetical protein
MWALLAIWIWFFGEKEDRELHRMDMERESRQRNRARSPILGKRRD